jgi:hypothetical protein
MSTVILCRKFSGVMGIATQAGRDQIAKLASIDETLLLENQVLRAKTRASNVRRLR